MLTTNLWALRKHKNYDKQEIEWKEVKVMALYVEPSGHIKALFIEEGRLGRCEAIDLKDIKESDNATVEEDKSWQTLQTSV